MIRWFKWIFGGGQWEADLLWKAWTRQKDTVETATDRYKAEVEALRALVAGLQKRIESLEQLKRIEARNAADRAFRARNWSEFRNAAEQAEGEMIDAHE